MYMISNGFKVMKVSSKVELLGVVQKGLTHVVRVAEGLSLGASSMAYDAVQTNLVMCGRMQPNWQGLCKTVVVTTSA
ncbi:hypothetical protein LR48_Vigan05g160900 [Vigna angularis]|uniref:Uncharacterized protein n=1 Tax=Phaseolus angularis TaxID=3914 RepID=A0A0L9UNA5_PHAAN|nr:hypothetical protein LR48_Vigan05g160900 [Vigna angularis]